MSTPTSTLETPWIIVIVFAVIISAQAMYIWLRLFGGRGLPARVVSSDRDTRPRSEYYVMHSNESRARGQVARRTGYSPQVPAPIAGGRW